MDLTPVAYVPVLDCYPIFQMRNWRPREGCRQLSSDLNTDIFDSKEVYLKPILSYNHSKSPTMVECRASGAFFPLYCCAGCRHIMAFTLWGFVRLFP
jgi:hypothetical protein